MNTSKAYDLGQKDGVTRCRKNISKCKTAEEIKAYNVGWASTASGTDFEYKANF